MVLAARFYGQDRAMHGIDIQTVETYLRGLQERIAAELEKLDGQGRFKRDSWQRAEGGGGESWVLRDGALFEQAGVNFSDVRGSSLPPSATAHRPDTGEYKAPAQKRAAARQHIVA